MRRPMSNGSVLSRLLLLIALAGMGCTGIAYTRGDGAVGADAAVDGQSPEDDAQTTGICLGVTCGQGDCVDVGGVAACNCDPGYHAEGLASLDAAVDHEAVALFEDVQWQRHARTEH